MGYLVCTERGDSAGLAFDLHRHGQDVFMYTKSTKLLNGLIGSSDNLTECLNTVGKNAVIVFEDSKNYQLAEGLETAGYKTLFSSKFGYQLENDKEHTKKLASSVGILVADETTKGLELYTYVFFVNGKPLYPYTSFTKQVTYYWDISMAFTYVEKEPRVIGQTIKKMSLLFEKSTYTGLVVLNTITNTDTKKTYIKDITTSIPYNSFYSLLSLLNKPIHILLQQLLTTKETTTATNMPFNLGWFSYCLSMLVLPIYSDLEVRFGDMVGVYPHDVRKVGDKFYAAGINGHLCDVSFSGQSTAEAYYSTVQKFKTIQIVDKFGTEPSVVEGMCQSLKWLTDNQFIQGKAV